MSPDPPPLGGVWERGYILPTSWERGRSKYEPFAYFLPLSSSLLYFLPSKIVTRSHSKHLQIWLNKHTTPCTTQVYNTSSLQVKVWKWDYKLSTSEGLGMRLQALHKWGSGNETTGSPQVRVWEWDYGLSTSEGLGTRLQALHKWGSGNETMGSPQVRVWEWDYKWGSGNETMGSPRVRVWEWDC